MRENLESLKKQIVEALKPIDANSDIEDKGIVRVSIYE